MGANPQGEFDPDIAELIHEKVKKFGFRSGEQEDIRQELSMHVVIGLKRFDLRRAGKMTFADKIVTSKIKTIVAHRNAQKRDRVRVNDISADEMDLPDRSQRVVDDQL